MMGESSIEWCRFTFNPWIGCEKVSPGCKNCYASVDTYARVSASRGLPLWGPGSSRHVTSDANWRKPFSWNKAAAKAGERHRVFCASLADVFEDRPDLLVPRARLAMLIANTPHLDWLLLTKRPENAARMWRVAFGGGLAPAHMNPWLPNVWLGTTVEDQQRANERIPRLLAVPAAVRFVSYEPALETVDFTRIVTWSKPGPPFPIGEEFNGLRGFCGATPDEDTPAVNGIDWVIIGGESGPGARPFDLAWARDVVSQCKASGVATFVKQMGRRPYDSNVNMSDYEPHQCLADVMTAPPEGVTGAAAVGLKYKDQHGGDWSEWPADLRVREYPDTAGPGAGKAGG